MHLTIRAERINLKEENFMNVVLKEKDFDVHETLHEEYENANNDIDCTEFELFSTFYKLAASEITFDDLVNWITKHAHNI